MPDDLNAMTLARDAENVHECGKCKSDDAKCYDDDSCEDTKTVYFDISVPYTIKPYAIPGKPKVTCVDCKVLAHGQEECHDNCDTFEYTCTQKICVELPVKFGAMTCICDTCVKEDNDDQREGER